MDSIIDADTGIVDVYKERLNESGIADHSTMPYHKNYRCAPQKLEAIFAC